MEKLVSTYERKESGVFMFVDANVDEAVRTCCDLKVGKQKIQEILDKIYASSLEIQTNMCFKEIRAVMNKNLLFRSDCSWTEYDDELMEMINRIDALENDFQSPDVSCAINFYNALSMRFVFHVMSELEEIKALLEAKVNDIEATIYASYKPILTKIG